MSVGSLSNLELAALRLDYNREVGDGCTCVIERIAEGTMAKDGSLPGDTPTTLYSGVCYITPIEARRDRWDDRGEEHTYQNQYRVLIPWDSAIPIQGDNFRVTASHSDAQLVGRDMMVKDIHFESELSMRRITVLDLKD